MIKAINRTDITECVNVIRESFMTVANELGFTEENAPSFTAFATTEDCVLPSYRHKGIGEQMLNHACDMAKTMNCTKMHIGIVEENKVLRHWYEEMGFVHIGTEKFDFFPFTCGYMEREL